MTSFRKKMVQATKTFFPYDLSFPTFIRERLIVTKSRINLNAIDVANMAFVEVTKSNTEYLMVENK